MKILNRLWLTILLLVLAAPVMADDVTYSTISSAAQKSNDLSRQVLVMIYGDVVTHPMQPSQMTLIGALFAIINGVLATVAIVWFASTLLKGIVKAGHQGSFFSSGRTISYPIMTLLGFMMIVPTGSGWSLAQLSMLWATSTMGIGSANLLTDKAVDMMNSGYSVVTQPTAASTRQAARGVFEMALCMYATNQELAELSSIGPTGTKPMTPQGTDDYYIISNGTAACGSYRLPTESDTTIVDKLLGTKVNTAPIVTAQKQALTELQKSLFATAKDFLVQYLAWRKTGQGTYIDVESKIQSAAAKYEDTVNLAIHRMDYADSLQKQLTEQMKSNGWIVLGAWYQTFATANSKTNDVAKSAPVVTGMSQWGETGTGELLNSVMIAYKTQGQNSAYVAPLGTQTSKDDAAAVTASDPNAKLVSFFSKPMQNITSTIATWEIGTASSYSNQVNPLIKMQTVGEYTLGTAELALTAYSAALGAASWASNSIVGKVGGFTAGDPGAVAKDVMSAVAPVFYFLLLALFGIGYTLAIFIPAVPFIFWMTAVINWIVSILVGPAAGPMWAATHLGAEEDKGSRSAYGYIFLIDMMLRPSLMVLGFFFASVAAVAAGTLLNTLFASALASANSNSFVGIVKMIGWLMIYARISTYAVTRLFALQSTLPDYVMAFIGGREGTNLMGGMADNVKGMFGAATSQVQRTPGVKMSSNQPAGQGGSGNNGIQ